MIHARSRLIARTHACSGVQQIRTWWNHKLTDRQVWEGGDGLIALHTRPARVPEPVDVVNHARHAKARDTLDKQAWQQWASERGAIPALEWCKKLADTGRIPYELIEGRVFPAGTCLSPPLFPSSVFYSHESLHPLVVNMSTCQVKLGFQLF